MSKMAWLAEEKEEEDKDNGHDDFEAYHASGFKIDMGRNVGDFVVMLLFEETECGCKGYVPIFDLIEEQLSTIANVMTKEALKEALVWKKSVGFDEQWPLESWRSK